MYAKAVKGELVSNDQLGKVKPNDESKRTRPQESGFVGIKKPFNSVAEYWPNGPRYHFLTVPYDILLSAKGSIPLRLRVEGLEWRPPTGNGWKGVGGTKPTRTGLFKFMLHESMIGLGLTVPNPEGFYEGRKLVHLIVSNQSNIDLEIREGRPFGLLRSMPVDKYVRSKLPGPKSIPEAAGRANGARAQGWSTQKVANIDGQEAANVTGGRTDKGPRAGEEIDAARDQRKRQARARAPLDGADHEDILDQPGDDGWQVHTGGRKRRRQLAAERRSAAENALFGREFSGEQGQAGLSERRKSTPSIKGRKETDKTHGERRARMKGERVPRRKLSADLMGEGPINDHPPHDERSRDFDKPRVSKRSGSQDSYEGFIEPNHNGQAIKGEGPEIGQGNNVPGQKLWYEGDEQDGQTDAEGTVSPARRSRETGNSQASGRNHQFRARDERTRVRQLGEGTSRGQGREARLAKRWARDGAPNDQRSDKSTRRRDKRNGQAQPGKSSFTSSQRGFKSGRGKARRADRMEQLDGSDSDPGYPDAEDDFDPELEAIRDSGSVIQEGAPEIPPRAEGVTVACMVIGESFDHGPGHCHDLGTTMGQLDDSISIKQEPIQPVELGQEGGVSSPDACPMAVDHWVRTDAGSDNASCQEESHAMERGACRGGGTLRRSRSKLHLDLSTDQEPYHSDRMGDQGDELGELHRSQERDLSQNGPAQGRPDITERGGIFNSEGDDDLLD